jgi:hypothetical protein
LNQFPSAPTAPFQPFLYFKPCLIGDDEFHWSVGHNKLLLMEEPDKRISYPHFFSSDKGTFSKLIEVPRRYSIAFTASAPFKRGWKPRRKIGKGSA